MFSNYFKIAFRVLWRNKIYVALNVVGLGFAIACCILAYLNYNYRANFDKNFAHTEHIYRVNSTQLVDGNKQTSGVIPLPLAQVIQKELVGLAKIARLSSSTVIVKREENTFNEHIYYVDKTFFNFFSFPLKSGNLSGFDQPDQLIISEGFAQKYFANEMPVGQSLTIVGLESNLKVYTVAAVLQKKSC